MDKQGIVEAKEKVHTLTRVIFDITTPALERGLREQQLRA